MENILPNFKHLDATDGKVYGKHNTVTSVNPYKCRFVAHYPDGTVKYGNNLFTTGWDELPHGIGKLEYVLSTGHLIEIPKYKAYLPLIETSVGTDGSRNFHAINVKCLSENSIIVYRIVLRQGSHSKYQIGDIIIGRERMPDQMSKSWKFTA